MKIKYHILPLITWLLLSYTQIIRAGTLNQTINFNATFYGGTCEITAPGELFFNNGNPINDDDIPGERIFQKFNVMLNGCRGYFMSPKISVSGNTITTSGNMKLFADTTSTTKGYGVRVATEGNTRFNANNNVSVNNIISAKNWPVSGSNDMTKLNGVLEFTGYLSCGSCTPGYTLNGGELKSTVTFSFLYN